MTKEIPLRLEGEVLCQILVGDQISPQRKSEQLRLLR